MLSDQVRKADASVARFDSARLRRQAGMMVTEADDLKDPEEILLDIATQNPTELLRTYRARQAKFVTAPFDPLAKKLKFFPGGYSIWSGFPGAGKSTLLRQSICHWLNAGEGVFVASLEEHPSDLLIRLAGTCFGRDEPTEQQLTWFCDFYADRLRIWGMIGVSSHRRILSTVQKLSPNGVTQVVIDSLMKLDIHGDMLEPQRQFSNLLAAVCQTSQVHTHLVAHPRKAQTNDQDVHLNDVGGAKEIPAGADNILFVRRGEEQPGYPDLCGMKISIRKQRHGSGMVGDITGWFNRSLRQFKTEQFDQQPTQYLPKQAYT